MGIISNVRKEIAAMAMAALIQNHRWYDYIWDKAHIEASGDEEKRTKLVNNFTARFAIAYTDALLEQLSEPK